MGMNRHMILRAGVALGLLANAPAVDRRRVTPAREVRIQRDEYGVPHVFADSVYGLFYGFGAALGEDQLYQVEILKRTAEGQVAEVLGSKFTESDCATRQRIDRASLERQFLALSATDQDIFRGMADGLNLRIAGAAADPKRLPGDFTINGFRPEPWSPLDVIAVYEHSMALRFSDLNSELDNLALLTRLRQDRGADAALRLFGQLRWVDDAAAPTTITAFDQRKLPVPTFAAPASAGRWPNALTGLSPDVLYGSQATAQVTTSSDRVQHASNAWLASARRLGFGRAVLVNGPQMGDYSSAYLWAIGLHGAGFDVVGSGPVGSPWLIFGSNGNIGWGATAGLGDTVDIYQEHLDPNDPHRYRFQGKWRVMDARHETIPVKGAAPLQTTVYATVHGPVDLFDVAHGVAYARKRSWAGQEVGSLVAWVHAMQARNYSQWRSAVSQVAITVNNYYADKRGNIAYQFLGRFPIRPPQQDFRVPANGDGTMEWRGTYSPLLNPAVLDPHSGLLANWNNKPQGGYHNSDFMYWSAVDRVSEIDEGLRRLDRVTPESLWSVVEQTSFTDVTARYFIDLVRAHQAMIATDGRLAPAAALLAHWDGVIADRETGRATAGYILYRAFLTRLLSRLFTPILPQGPGRVEAERDYLQFNSVFPTLGVKIAYATLTGTDPGNLRNGQDVNAVLSDALSRGLGDVVERYGPAQAHWSEPAQPHVFGINNYAGIPQSTEEDPPTLPVLFNRGTENDMIVFDRGAMRYCDVTPPGESGFVDYGGHAGPHRRDQLDLYARFQCKREWLKRSDIDAHTRSTEVLTVSGRARVGIR